MTVNDVDLVAQPNAGTMGFIIQPADADSRLTFQNFNNHDPVTTLIAPHNSDARQSDSNEWPPPLIFDVAYGCAGLNTWGVPTFMNFARERTRNIYYNQVDNGDDENGGGAGGSGGGGGGDGGNGGGVSGHGEKHSQQMSDRAARANRWAARGVGLQASNTVDSQASDVADMVLALWMQNAGKAQRQAHAMKAGRTREKVRTWLDSAE